jgi:hypothetical protein
LVERLSYLVRAIGRLLQQHSVYYEIEHSTEICIEPVCPQALVPSPVAPADVAKNGRGTTAMGSNGKGA